MAKSRAIFAGKRACVAVWIVAAVGGAMASESSEMGRGGADAMPHVLAPHLTASDVDLAQHMNAYSGGAASDTITWPSSLEGSKIPATSQSALDAPLPKTVDEVLVLLKSLKFLFTEEDQNDAATSYADSSPQSSHLTSARQHYDEAVKNVEKMHIARDNNATMYAKIAEYKAKGTHLAQLLEEKASLTREEGIVRLPILSQLNTLTNLQVKAGAAKKKALNDFATHPSLSLAEKNQIINTYNQLLVNLKQQEAVLHGQASSGLVPLQLNINQTTSAIQRLKTESQELRREIQDLVNQGDAFSVEALAVGMAIEADLDAHFKSLLDARHAEEAAFAARSEDRSVIIRSLDQLLMAVQGVHPPQDV